MIRDNFLPILSDLFQRFNNENISYCILRDFDSFEHINNGGDLDLSIKSNDKGRVIDLLESLTWLTAPFAVNDFSHTQFFKWDGFRLYKLDIIWDCYFEDGKYSLNPIIDIYQCERNLGCARTPSIENAIYLLLSHIAFDKKELSPKNKAFLHYLRIELNGSNELNEFVDFVLNCDFKNIEVISNYLIKNSIVFKNHYRIWRINKLLKRICYRLKTRKQYKFVIIGVDGTGKSSALNKVEDYYKNKVHTEYFGFRSWQTSMAKKYIDNNPIRYSAFRFPIRSVAMFREMRHRYNNSIRSHKPLLVYDRYVWEAYINTDNKLAKCIYRILFLTLFPKPDGIIYLYCPVEVSLSRKDDIEDHPAFIKMKERFDSMYLHNNDILKIDTSLIEESQEIMMIVSYIFIKTNGTIC